MATPFQTSKADWDSFFDRFYVYFNEKMKAKATKASAIDTYYPVNEDGSLNYEEFKQAVKSLPSLYDYQGERKTVLVPLEALSHDAKLAADEARQAASDSKTATAEAKAARDNANRAAQEADQAREKLEEIEAKTEAATKAANDAANNANLAASEAKATNERIEAAEALREQAFTDALGKFQIDLKDLNDFTALVKEAWLEFEKQYESKQAQIDEAEKSREEAEKEREEAEAKRKGDSEKALGDVKTATDRFNELCDHPPILQGDPLTWWIWDEASGEYTDTGNTAQYPELYPFTAEMWRKLMQSDESEQEENNRQKVE